MNLYSVDFGGERVKFTPSKLGNLPHTVSNEHFTLVRKMRETPVLLIDQWLHFGDDCELMFNGRGQVIDYLNGEARIIHLTPEANVNLTLQLMERHACSRCTEKLPMHVTEGGFFPDYERYTEDYGVCEHLLAEAHVCPEFFTVKLGNKKVCSKCAEECLRCHKVVPSDKICDFSPQYCYKQSYLSVGTHSRSLPSGYVTREEYSETNYEHEECACGCGILYQEHRAQNWKFDMDRPKPCGLCMNIEFSNKCGKCGKIRPAARCNECANIRWRCTLCQQYVCLTCDDVEQKPHDDHMGTYCSECVKLNYRVCTDCHKEMVPPSMSCTGCKETLTSMDSWTGCRNECPCRATRC